MLLWLELLLLLLLWLNSIIDVQLLLDRHLEHLGVETDELLDGEALDLCRCGDELSVSVLLLGLRQLGELREEQLLLVSWQLVQQLVRTSSRLLGLKCRLLLPRGRRLESSRLWRLELLLLRLNLLLFL